MIKMCYIVACFLICGCYSQKRAQQDVAKADAIYPAIIARLCADKFPVAEIFIPGDSVIVFDTIQGEGITITETITVKDTVTITKTLPAKVITKTIIIHDTVRLTNTAAVKACEIVRDQALQLATDKTAEAVSWKKKAKRRYWVMLGLILALGVFTYFKVKGIFVK